MKASNLTAVFTKKTSPINNMPFIALAPKDHGDGSFDPQILRNDALNKLKKQTRHSTRIET
jgi:hypothetical protein